MENQNISNARFDLSKTSLQATIDESEQATSLIENELEFVNSQLSREEALVNSSAIVLIEGKEKMRIHRERLQIETIRTKCDLRKYLYEVQESVFIDIMFAIGTFWFNFIGTRSESLAHYHLELQDTPKNSTKNDGIFSIYRKNEIIP